jgi:hypothetical protein
MGPIDPGFNVPMVWAGSSGHALFGHHPTPSFAGMWRIAGWHAACNPYQPSPHRTVYEAREDAGLIARRNSHEKDRSGDQAF